MRLRLLLNIIAFGTLAAETFGTARMELGPFYCADC